MADMVSVRLWGLSGVCHDFCIHREEDPWKLWKKAAGTFGFHADHVALLHGMETLHGTGERTVDRLLGKFVQDGSVDLTVIQKVPEIEYDSDGEPLPPLTLRNCSYYAKTVTRRFWCGDCALCSEPIFNGGCPCFGCTGERTFSVLKAMEEEAAKAERAEAKAEKAVKLDALQQEDELADLRYQVVNFKELRQRQLKQMHKFKKAYRWT